MPSSVSRALVLCLPSLLAFAGAAGADRGAAFRVADPPRDPPASVTGEAIATRFNEQRADALMVPFFKVDRSNAAGETTLIAVRNATGQAHDVVVEYWVDHPFDPRANPDLTQAFSLIADEVRTVNLRDLPAINGGAGGDEVILGWILVRHADGEGDALSADWLRVNSAENFATGGRMVDVDHSTFCTQWDLRYLVGGGFDGGTRLEVFVATPLGNDPIDDLPSFVLEFFSERGASLGALEAFVDTQVTELDVGDLLAQLPGSPATLGAVVVTFEPGTNGGLVSGTYRAEDRYSVGLDGTCIVP